MAKRSRIEWDEIGEGWAVHCCECGDYIETVAEKPTHTAFTCPDDCEVDTWADDLDEGYVEEWYPTDRRI